MPRRIFAVVFLLVGSQVARATIVTNTRSEIAQMAGFWEVDTIQMSPLANAQYPTIGGGTSTWQYIFAQTSASSDGDLHHAMAINSSGTGQTGNNIGNSPIVAEIVNVTGSQISTVSSLSAANNHRVVPRGIFRFYTEHSGEIHFEVHPITQHLTNSGGAFVVAADFHSSITNDPYARHGYALSTMQSLVDGTITMTAQMMADNNRVILTYPTGAGGATMNYPEYDGRVMQPLTNDACGPYFTFLPTNSPAGAISGARVIRCRVVANTLAAPVAAGLVSNMAVNVNGLNRIDMLVLSNAIAPLSANGSSTFVRPVEFITLGLKVLGTVSSPSAIFSGTPTNGVPPLTVTFTDTSTGSITNRSWDFGDASTTNITAASVQHVYNSVGTNTVTLTLTGLGGSANSIRTNYIVVGSASSPPSASFTGNPTNGTEPLLVTFTDTSTGNITSRSWDFGDTTTTNVTTNNVAHTYSAGTYPVTLVVTGPDGDSTNTHPNYIVVSNAPPSASFSGNPTSGTEPLLVTFTDTSTGSITSRSWDFGDTSTTNVTTNAVSHTYAAGTYDVTLIVTGPGGVSTNTQINYITALTTFQSWQVQFFGSTTNTDAAPSADPDGDGCDNLCEYLTGTDPTNGASFFHITAVTSQGDDILVTWATAGGRTNVVQVNAGDVDGSYTTNFIDLSPFIIIPGSSDAFTNYLDIGGATNSPSRYYRIRLQP